MMDRIGLMTLGLVPANLITWLVAQLGRHSLTVVYLGAMNLPADAFCPDRRQYRGEGILTALRKSPLSRVDRTLGLVAADCYTEGLTFVFGQAEVGGRLGFVALERLQPSFYGATDDRRLFYDRTLKEVVHELGHTWGLSHCVAPLCVMYYSNTLQHTDHKGPGFCPRCTQLLLSR